MSALQLLNHSQTYSWALGVGTHAEPAFALHKDWCSVPMMGQARLPRTQHAYALQQCLLQACVCAHADKYMVGRWGAVGAV